MVILEKIPAETIGSHAGVHGEISEKNPDRFFLSISNEIPEYISVGIPGENREGITRRISVLMAEGISKQLISFGWHCLTCWMLQEPAK